MGASPSSPSFYLAKRDFPLGARDRRRLQPFLFFSFLSISPRGKKRRKMDTKRRRRRRAFPFPSAVTSRGTRGRAKSMEFSKTKNCKNPTFTFFLYMLHDACRFQKLETAIVEFLLIRLFLFCFRPISRWPLLSSSHFFFANFSFCGENGFAQIIADDEGRRRSSFGLGPRNVPPGCILSRRCGRVLGICLIGLAVLGKKKNSGLALTVRGRRKRLGEISLYECLCMVSGNFLCAGHFAIETIGCISEIILRLN